MRQRCSTVMPSVSDSGLAVQMHVVKNFIADQLDGVNPPLILGIWGPKGCGKTFQTELAFKKLKCACLLGCVLLTIRRAVACVCIKRLVS